MHYMSYTLDIIESGVLNIIQLLANGSLLCNELDSILDDLKVLAEGCVVNFEFIYCDRNDLSHKIAPFAILLRLSKLGTLLICRSTFIFVYLQLCNIVILSKKNKKKLHIILVSLQILLNITKYIRDGKE